jgi:hypothetical protein
VCNFSARFSGTTRQNAFTWGKHEILGQQPRSRGEAGQIEMGSCVIEILKQEAINIESGAII